MLKRVCGTKMDPPVVEAFALHRAIKGNSRSPLPNGDPSLPSLPQTVESEPRHDRGSGTGNEGTPLAQE